MFTVGNMFNNLSNGYGNNVSTIMSQVRQCQQNPNAILDILAQNGKINQQQYQELQQYNGNAQQIANYLMNHGCANQINQIMQQIGMNMQ